MTLYNCVRAGAGAQLKPGQRYDVKASFTNPLKKPLTSVVYYVEGSKLTAPLTKQGK